MNEILRKKYSRNLLIGSAALFILVVLLIRYLALPYFFPSIVGDWGTFFSNILNGLVTSTIITITVGVFVYWLQPEIAKNAKIEIENQHALGEMFSTAFSKTDLWYYKGGCGRYFRTKTLPEIAKYARKKTQSKEVLVVILDPTDIDLCKKHAIYRSGTASQEIETEKWTLEKVRLELFSTIVTTLVIQVNEPLLRITISLCSHYSSFRIDLSDEYAVITKEDRNAPAIICHKDTYFYKAYKDEVVLSLNQSKKLNKIDYLDLNLGDITAENVKDILKEIGVYDSALNDSFYGSVASVCKLKKNPYE